MAEQAFALSPIAASASLPTQADYDAISGAFMETARGRWFLAEYARRNRNADTSMVLEAVARIERTLAEQKQPPRMSDADVMPAVTAILAAARASAETAFANPATYDALIHIRQSARVIREVAWGLRESGADSRISGALDTQISAIETACDRSSTSDLRNDVLAALDRAAEKIAELDTSIKRPAPVEVLVKTPFEPKIVPAAAVMVEDHATKTEATKPEPIETETVVRLEPPQIASPPTPLSVPAPAKQTVDETVLFANIGGSLGASLLVSGIVPKPAPKSDPLAPIRRMSAAEKIAFFS